MNEYIIAGESMLLTCQLETKQTMCLRSIPVHISGNTRDPSSITANNVEERTDATFRVRDKNFKIRSKLRNLFPL